MPRKEFDAFTRLDASDVNTLLMDQTVMSFAGTAARGSAIPTPTLGMYTHLEDAPARTQFWNGSAWVSPFGETLLSSVPFTNQSEINLSSVFSSNFDNYRIDLNINSVSANMDLLFRMRLGSTDNSTATYFSTGISTIQTTTSISVTNVNAGTSGFISGAANTQTLSGAIRIFNPNVASRTYVTAQCAGIFGDFRHNVQGSLFNADTQFDGITIFPSAGTISGNIRLYGSRNA
jgi:hypothetical protein